MFLFTTPSTPPESVQPPALSRPAPDAPPRAVSGQSISGQSISGPVVQAIRDGAMASGVGFDYLLATARRESALDPAAKAGTSSATGLFQFIEQTWLGVMKSAGPRLGLQAQADAIARQPDGTYAVPDSGQRQAILDLRRDPKISATLAGALTQKNAEALGTALGREPTPGDLYAAHVLGAKGAAALISTARAFPERAAALDLPEAAGANRALFYDRAGRPRTAAELYASLSAAQGGAQAAAPSVSNLGAARPAGGQETDPAPITAAAFGGTADLRSLFQTERRGAVSDAAARLWQGRRAPPPAPHAQPSYFPRSGAEPTAGDGPGTTGSLVTARLAEPVGAPAALAGPPAAGPALGLAPGLPLSRAPLPPRRPAEFATTRPAPDTAAAATAGAARSLTAAAAIETGPRGGLRNSLFVPRSGP